MGSVLLQEIVIIFCLAIVVLLVCHRFRVPSVVGFLLTGVLCGPYGISLVNNSNDVQIFADIGVVLLLFSVGLEFSIKNLWHYRRYFLFAGFIQVFLTVAVSFGIAQLLGRPIGESIYLGFLLSLSSTAIVMHVLEQRHELFTPQGKLMLGILIFQDIAAVVMMLLTPILAGQQLQHRQDESIVMGLLIVIVVFALSIQFIPKLMRLIARTKSRELFLLTTICICFSVAWITERAGLSLPLGAFLAGLIVSESEYSSEAIADILPFQDVFLSLFFVSIGMLLDLQFVIAHPLLILIITGSVLVMKACVASISVLFVGMSVRMAILVGLSICQIGEFSFVLAKSGMAFNLGSDHNMQLFLAVAILTMALTPTLIHYAPALAAYGNKLPLPNHMMPIENEMQKNSNHVVIIGYGNSGKIVSASCKTIPIPYTIIEMDPLIVKAEEQPIVLGDASHYAVLRHANIEAAKILVILINDPTATLHIIEHAQKINPDIYIIVRSRWVKEIQPLIQRGVHEVIADEMIAGNEIFNHVLHQYERTV